MHSQKKERGALSKSDKADRVLTNRWGPAIPIFVAILFFVFHLTFGEDLFYLNAIFGFGFDVETGNAYLDAFVAVFFNGAGISTPGAILFNLTDFIMNTCLGGWIADGMAATGAAAWAQGLVNDGIWGGVAGVMSFVPQVLVLFLFLSILEDSGYMARVAFILDRIFRRFGVSGRAFIPMNHGVRLFGARRP